MKARPRWSKSAQTLRVTANHSLVTTVLKHPDVFNNLPFRLHICAGGRHFAARNMNLNDSPSRPATRDNVRFSEAIKTSHIRSESA
jgi:hypothetical protein